MSKSRNLANLLSGGVPAFGGTDALDVPAGTTAQRPSNPDTGFVRFNTDLDQLEQYTNDSGWQGISPPPTITTTDVTTVQESDSTQTVVITGQNFDAAAVGSLVDANGVTKTPTTSTRNSSSQVTITYSGGDVLDNSVAEPLSVKVVNGSGLSAVLDNQINVNASPTWGTTAGSLGTVIEDETITNIALSATDADGDSVTFALSSGSSLPSGLSLSSSGIISGTPNVNDAYSTGVTHNFSVDASDGSATNTRAFNIVRKWRDGLSSDAASTPLAIRNLGVTTDGLYWIKHPSINGGNPLQMYLDMSKNGVPWVLLITNNATNSAQGWTDTNIQSRNESSASLTSSFSHLQYCDVFKPSSGSWQYMLETVKSPADYRYYAGGIFTANVNSYSLNTTSNGQTNISNNEWFSPAYNFADNQGVGTRVPYRGASYAEPDAIYTTYPGTSSWWGTLVTGDGNWSSYKAGPWMSGSGTADYNDPNVSRVWIRSYI